MSLTLHTLWCNHQSHYNDIMTVILFLIHYFRLDLIYDKQHSTVYIKRTEDSLEARKQRIDSVARRKLNETCVICSQAFAFVCQSWPHVTPLALCLSKVPVQPCGNSVALILPGKRSLMSNGTTYAKILRSSLISDPVSRSQHSPDSSRFNRRVDLWI